MSEYIGFNALIFVLSIFMFCYVTADRSYQKQARYLFQVAFFCTGILMIADTLKTIGEDVGSVMVALHGCMARSTLRPLMLLSVFYVVIREMKTRIRVFLAIPVAINAVLAALSIPFGLLFSYVRENGEIIHINTKLGTYSYALSALYIVLLLVFSVVVNTKNNRRDFAMVLYIAGICVGALLLEEKTGNNYLLDATATIGIVLFYLYEKGENYKLDALTHLLNRHNLNLYAQDLENEDYDVIFIDIDNFKLINDKYGHLEGDRAICEVVDETRRQLIKNCKMYRYGGDEFVIISRKNTVEQLDAMLEKVNTVLADKNYSISSGITHHEPGEVFQEVCDKADMLMYEHKRKAKSEDIWDQMTGLFNLRGFTDELEIQKKHVMAQKLETALVCIDIDRLGNINDIYGHKEGDALIRTVAKLIDECVEKGEFIGHVGMDEFIIALTIQNAEDPYPTEFVNRVLEKVKFFNALGEKEYTLEINHSVYVVNMKNWTDVNTAIEEAFYTKRISKNNKKHAAVLSTETEAMEYNAEDEKKVLKILSENKLDYVFQPVVTAVGGNIIGYEGLMRCADGSDISPLGILQYASKNQMLYEVERHTFFNILDCVEKNADAIGDKKIFINSIPGQFLDDADYERLRERFALYFSKMVVEITEQSQLDEQDLQRMQEYSKKDYFELAIDDYGSGYSNTNSLLRYMPHIVKIDRFLVNGLEKDGRKRHFVSSVIEYAHANGIKVLAEGVETAMELRSVIHMGVDYIQGFYLAEPTKEFIPEISEKLRSEIVRINLQRHETTDRKIMLVQSDTDLSVMQLAMEMYTGILIGTGFVRIYGNSGYMADMSIRIKDDSELRLVLNDVEIKDTYKLPCIELGERVKLTLVLEGDNRLDGGGIRVPESSEIRVEGSGNLHIGSKGHGCFGIGNEPDIPIGKVHFAHSGLVDISVDGNRCCAIGGGASESSSISCNSGRFNLQVAAETGVGIGCFEGKMPIHLDSFEFDAECHVREGSIIGSIHGPLDVFIARSKCCGHIAGTNITGIGSAFEGEGNILLEASKVEMAGNGQYVMGVGAEKGALSLKLTHVGLSTNLEGNSVCGLGNFEKTASVIMDSSTATMRLLAGAKLPVGAEEENIKTNMGDETFVVEG